MRDKAVPTVFLEVDEISVALVPLVVLIISKATFGGSGRGRGAIIEGGARVWAIGAVGVILTHLGPLSLPKGLLRLKWP